MRMRMHGVGTFTYGANPNGWDSHRGGWKDGEMHGWGVTLTPDGDGSISDYDHGSAVGVGVGWSGDGALVYTRVGGDFGEAITKEAARERATQVGFTGVGPFDWP